MGSYLKSSFKLMLHQREFFFALTFSFVLILGCLFSDLISYIGNDVIYRNPAWLYFGTSGGGFRSSIQYGSVSIVAHVIQIFLGVLSPFVAAMAFAFFHFDNTKSGLLKVLLPRVGSEVYYRATAITVFLGGFLVVFLPLLFEQIVLCIAFPWQVPFNVSRWPPLDDYTGFLGIPAQYAFLQINHPYLYNFILCLVPGVTGGILAYCSYTFSLFFQRNRFLILTLPGMALWVIPQYALQAIPATHIFSQKVMILGPKTDFLLWGGVVLLVLSINIILKELKIHRFKDEIS